MSSLTPIFATVKSCNNFQFFGNYKPKSLSTNLKFCRLNKKINFVAYNNGDDKGPVLPSHSSPLDPWKIWNIVGIIISALIPLWKFKSWPLKLKGNFGSVVEMAEEARQATDALEKVVEGVEKAGGTAGDVMEAVEKVDEGVEKVEETAGHVTDAVGKVAGEVEMVAEEIDDHLPEGELKEVVTVVENIAKETVTETHVVHQVIDKIEDVEKEAVFFMETFTGHIQNKGNKGAKNRD